jgi:uncharacterized protein (DUF433 family)
MTGRSLRLSAGSSTAQSPSHRQEEVLAFMRMFAAANGVPPTIREICTNFGFRSTNSAFCILKILERKGLVRSYLRGKVRFRSPVYAGAIVCDPGIRSGWPGIAGTRLGVELVAESIAAGETVEQYAADKGVSVDQVREALAVYEGMKPLFEAFDAAHPRSAVRLW